MQWQMERARETDRDELLRFVQECELTSEGLGEHVGTALVVRHKGRIVGSATLELYPDGALLRSVAVAREHRGKRLGELLTLEALELAAALDVSAVFLLTLTAEAFFPRFGFERIERHVVPAGVRNSLQFSSACPATATVMRRRLSANPAAEVRGPDAAQEPR